MKFDAIIIGSGPAGAMAAHKLVNSKSKVLMIDGGITGKTNSSETKSFEEIRLEKDQEKLFFPDYKGIVPKYGRDSHSGSMTSGAREYISSQTEEFLPVKSKLEITESLAKGGLSEAWGAACATFNDSEIVSIGFSPLGFKKKYQEAIDLMGTSGSSKEFDLMPQARLDRNASTILSKYGSKVKSRFKVVPPMLALLTKDKGKRKKTNYQDLDYWINAGDSIYRSRFTIEDLERKNNFVYLGNSLALKFKENKNGVEVTFRDIAKGKEKTYSARYLILAAGAINSTRLVFSSQSRYNRPSNLFVKDHFLLPCLNISMLGKKSEKHKHSLCQLCIYPNNNKVSSVFAQVYSYKSLLFYKLLNSSSLPKPAALMLTSLFYPAITILDVRFPVFGESCDISLLKNGEISIQEKTNNRKLSMSRIKHLKKFLVSLRLVPIGGEWAPLGSTVHYAGGLDTDKDCLVSGYSRVFSADSASWKSLPAKPPTLTIMANSARVSDLVLDKIKNDSVYKSTK